MWKEETTTNHLLRSSRNSKIGRLLFSPFKRLAQGDFDFSLFLVYILFLGIGVVQVYSSSFIYATEKIGDGLFFFRKQLLFTLVSFTAMLFAMNLPLKFFKKFALVFWILCSFAVLLVFVPGVGVRVGGALRWLQLPFGFRLESSEFLKLCLPMLMAYLMVKNWKELGAWELPAKAFIVLAPLIVLLKQPDFGSFAISLLMIGSILFCFGLAYRYIFGAILSGGALFMALIWFVPYRKARFMAFLDPWSDPSGSSFQVVQSMLSFYNGGVTGVGLGQGQGKLFFLPEAHTDFTFAVFGEEFGFVGLVAILCLYGFIVLRGIRISMKSQDYFARVMCLGLTAYFVFQVSINLAVDLVLLPTKGLTLPFLSYGGSSLVSMGILIGLILNVSRYQRRT
ncbi:MAG: putative lipid II flippase FtsW [Bdellovibrionales bacterium]